MKKKLNEGDIFYVCVNQKYIFARILLDVDRILKKESNHKAKFYTGCYLIEVYDGLYEEPNLLSQDIILPSQFTFKKYFYSKNYKVEWTFYNSEKIDYTQLDFPENLETGADGFINFRKFDVSLPTKTLFKNFPENSSGNQKYTATICGSYYQMVDEVFHLQGRNDLMQTKRTHFLENNDLRLSPKDRLKFYQQIEEDPNISYYELALKHGFDLGRFY